MFSFQQATRPIHQIPQLTLEPQHSALTFADFAQWARRIGSLNFADDFDESWVPNLGGPAAVPQAARVPHEVFPIAEGGRRQNLPVNVSLGP
jgi:hypothetical protein